MSGYIFLYLVAIIAANLTLYYFGPAVLVVNAFLFIGLDLTARDTLHDQWQGKGLFWKMLLLIGCGSLLSWLLNSGAASIAIASFLAFFAAGVSDTVVYWLLGNKRKLVKINGSNVISAFIDSLLFPLLAFGFPIMWWIVAGQFLAKVLGGFIWAVLIERSEQ
jgi:hypothetical protein